MWLRVVNQRWCKVKGGVNTRNPEHSNKIVLERQRQIHFNPSFTVSPNVNIELKIFLVSQLLTLCYCSPLCFPALLFHWFLSVVHKDHTAEHIKIISAFLVCSVLLWFINRDSIRLLEEPGIGYLSKPGFCVNSGRPLPTPPCPTQILHCWRQWARSLNSSECRGWIKVLN